MMRECMGGCWTVVVVGVVFAVEWSHCREKSF